MADITNQPFTGIDHDLIGMHNRVSSWCVFQSLCMICSIESVRCWNSSLGRMIRQYKHQGNVRMLLFRVLDSCSSNPIKSAIPANIKIADIFSLDQPINYQFQSGEQALICLPVAHEETAFTIHNILTIAITRIWVNCRRVYFQCQPVFGLSLPFPLLSSY